MDIKNIKNKTKSIERRLAELPRGYISRKVINGKERFYRQWREGSKLKSKYIKSDELEYVQAQIEERKHLEQELREMSKLTLMQSSKPSLYLKWGNTVIGEIDEEYNVRFTKPEYNKTVSIYTKGKTYWTREEFTGFCAERIPNRDRRDIEKILFKCGLNSYDVIGIAKRTKCINAKDYLWITNKKREKYNDAMTDVFKSIFVERKDLEGDSVDTPEGYNVKRYGVYNGMYGIYKKRISPLSTDVESEVAVYKLAELLGVDCCPCFRTDDDTVFSAFQYDFLNEYIVHLRRLVAEPRGDDELMNLMSVRPQYFAGFAKMIALDFITRQDDRHLSNIAIKIAASRNNTEVETLYPLYDNGRSLFYDDTEETVSRAVKDIEGFCTTFGPTGTYLNHIRTIKTMGVDFSKLLNLNGLTKSAVKSILKNSGFKDYHLEGSLDWIMECKTVLTSNDSFERREEILKLRSKVLQAEEERLSGARSFTTEEIENMLNSKCKKRQ